MDAKEWILNEDQVGQQDRIDRLQWLIDQTPVSDHSWLFHGGLTTKFLFEEVRYCFVYGQFLAVILLGLSFIEHTFASQFFAAGHDDLERASISKLLKEALAIGWITQDECDHLDHGREIRNAVTHFRKPGDEERIEFKSVEVDELPYEVIEEEARFMVIIMFQILGRFSGAS